MAMDHIKKAKLEPLQIKALAALLSGDWAYAYTIGTPLYGIDLSPDGIHVEGRQVPSERLEEIFQALGDAGVITPQSTHIKTFGIPHGKHRVLLPETELKLLREEVKDVRLGTVVIDAKPVQVADAIGDKDRDAAKSAMAASQRRRGQIQRSLKELKAELALTDPECDMLRAVSGLDFNRTTEGGTVLTNQFIVAGSIGESLGYNETGENNGVLASLAAKLATKTGKSAEKTITVEGDRSRRVIIVDPGVFTALGAEPRLKPAVEAKPPSRAEAVAKPAVKPEQLKAKSTDRSMEEITAKVEAIKEKAGLSGSEANALETVATVAMNEDRRGYIFRFNKDGQIGKKLGYKDGEDKGTIGKLSAKLKELEGVDKVDLLLSLEDSGPQMMLIVDKRVFEQALGLEPRRPIFSRPVGS